MPTFSHRRRRAITVVALTTCIGIAFITAIKNRQKPEHRSASNRSQDAQYILSPTNGVVRRIMITEGERVPHNAPLLRISNPAYEQRVQTARDAVARARLELNEEPLASASSTGVTATDASIAQLQYRIHTERDARDIRNKNQQIRNYTRELTSLQATRIRIQADPLNTSDISTTETALSALQAKRDVAVSDLKRLTERAHSRMKKGSGASVSPQRSSAINRSRQGATEMLTFREAELEAVLREELQNGVDILAPFTGLIMNIRQREGNYVRRGQPLLTLTSLPDR